jgi:hypothetical protein
VVARAEDPDKDYIGPCTPYIKMYTYPISMWYEKEDRP